MFTTQNQIRAAFWQEFNEMDIEARRRRTRSKSQNFQNATTRTAFCDFVDYLRKSNEISAELAEKVTL